MRDGTRTRRKRLGRGDIEWWNEVHSKGLSDTVASELRKTPLHARHRASNARMVPYAGWDMPVEYSGISNEHLAVRSRAGVFDVSHMGEIEIAGKNALAAVQLISSNDAALLQTGQAQYAALTTPDGTFVDDMLVYRMAPSHFMVVVNAANTAKAFAWISEQVKTVGDVAAIDSSNRYALIAVQGPAAREVLQPLTGVELADIGYYRFGYGEVAAARATISRTGYTGEDGFEISVPATYAEELADALTANELVKPIGLGARDSLRLEAGLPLYGHDLDHGTTPVMAGLNFAINKRRRADGGFAGAMRILAEIENGPAQKRVGFDVEGRQPVREGALILDDEGNELGKITSGGFSPTLQRPIAMGYVATPFAEAGIKLKLEQRGKLFDATVAAMPFVPHRYHRKGAA